MNPLIDYIVHKLDGSTDIVSVEAIGSADAVMTLWVQRGHGDREAARHKTGAEMCKTLGLRGAGDVLIDEQALLACVPGKLEHAGAEAIARRYMKRLGLIAVSKGRGAERVYHSHSYAIEQGVERALTKLVAARKVADQQGNKGWGYTLRDEAYQARAAAANARRDANDATRKEAERRVEAVVEALEALGISADVDYLNQIVLKLDDGEKLVALLGSVKTRRTA